MNLKPCALAIGVISMAACESAKDYTARRISEMGGIETLAETVTKAAGRKEPQSYETEGKISVYGNYAITAKHVTSKTSVKIQAFRGYYESKLDVIDEKTFIDSFEIHPVAKSEEQDYAIFDLSKTPNLCEAYCNDRDITKEYIPMEDVYVGMEVEFLASPRGNDEFYRTGVISHIAQDLDFVNMEEGDKEEGPVFLIDTFVHGGTSGTMLYEKESGRPVGMLTFYWGSYGGGHFLDDIVEEIENYERGRP